MDTTDGLVRGMEVRDTGAPIAMPVGPECLGRILNVIGEPVDEAGPVNAKQHVADPPAAADVPRPVDEGRGLRDRHQGHRPPRPVPQGRQDRPLRRRRRRQDRPHPGAHQQRRQGARRRVVLRRRRRAHARGQRSLPRDERVASSRSGEPVISKTALVFGQMNEPPGARARVALSALTVAEYFRDEEGQDVLLFVDNIFRFTQAGSEVSALLGRIPSAVGYQPTLSTEMGALQERITSTNKGSITSVQAIYVPADDLTDPAPATTFAHLDATTVSQPRPRRARHLPGRRSARLDVDAARPARRRRATTTTSRARSSRRSRSTRTSRTSSRSSAWTSSARTTSSSSRAPARSSASSRSRSSSPRSSPARRASYVPLKETIAGFEEILDGKLDDDAQYPEQAFYLVGNIDEMKAKAAELVEEEVSDGNGHGRQDRARDRDAEGARARGDRSTRSPRRASHGEFGVLPGHLPLARRAAHGHRHVPQRHASRSSAPSARASPRPARTSSSSSPTSSPSATNDRSGRRPQGARRGAAELEKIDSRSERRAPKRRARRRETKVLIAARELARRAARALRRSAARRRCVRSRSTAPRRSTRRPAAPAKTNKRTPVRDDEEDERGCDEDALHRPRARRGRARGRARVAGHEPLEAHRRHARRRRRVLRDVRHGRRLDRDRLGQRAGARARVSRRRRRLRDARWDARASARSRATPQAVRFGVVLVAYAGAEDAPRGARTKHDALELAQKLASQAKTDFHAAVRRGDEGSSDDVGSMRRGVLEPAPEYVLFSLPQGGVSDPVDTPRGYLDRQANRLIQ